MATQASTVMDLFMARVSDYRLNTIYATGSLALITYLEPQLLDSIDDFGICTQALTYTPTSGSTQGYFSVDLTTKNQIVLSRIMTKYWMQKTTNDVLQMTNILQDHDYTTYSQAQNLKAKQDYLNVIKEEVSQLLVDYANNQVIDWTNWQSQIFT